MTALFVKGLAFGFVLAATVGPMWLLCFRRTIASGALAGLVTGMGIAVGDAIYGAIAAFGLTAISGLLLAHRLWLGLLGAAFLAYLGIRALTAPPAAAGDDRAPSPPLASAFLSTLGLTLANPPTILAFAAIFAGLGLSSAGGDYLSAILLVIGVFLGSALWWLLLSGGIGLFRTRFPASGLIWVNRISGAIIAGFGLLALFGSRPG